MRFRTQFDSDYKSSDYSLIFDKEGCVVQQHQKDICDINKIMNKWLKTGVVEHVRKVPGSYADVTGFTDYQSACDLVNRADESFGSLPAKVRRRFENDPAQFLDWMSSSEDLDMKRELGLLVDRSDLSPKLASSDAEGQGT